jgi:PAS domain S-box-containing protein
MKDQNKTKKQLINELVELRLRMAELGALEDGHKRSEAALEQLAAIVQSSDDAIIGKTLEGIILSWNSGAERIYGYSSAEVIGRYISILLPPNRPDEVSQFLERIGRGERIDHYETVRIRKDGQLIHISLMISPVRDTTGKIVGASTIARDISGHKRVEEALRESEERYRSLFEGSRDAIYTTSQEGEILDANRSMLDLFGFSREEMIGLKARETYVHPEDRLKFQQKIEREGFVRDYEIKLRKKDGTEMDCLLTATVRRTAGENILGYQGIIRDITERKRAEEALKESELKYRTLIESSTDAILVLDVERNIVTCNQAFLNLFGYQKGEIEGRSIRIIHPSDESFHSFGKTAYPVVARSGFFRKEWRFTHKDGMIFPAETVTSAIKLPDGSVTGYIGIIRDITERKGAEEEREKLIHELQEALANIKTLHGLLPICSYCKKIRDDKGYWNQIESYIRDHSAAEFTHGMCPECMKKLYPDLVD